MKNTKKSLLLSVVSMLLCFSMLLGTSWAWFTDSVSSGSNVIKSGNLDLDVQYTLDGKTWNDLDGADDLFQKSLWEPGHTEVVALKITNKGSLALKYEASMNIIKETIGKNKDGGNIVLSEILTVSTLTFAEAGVDPLFGFNIAERSIEEAFKGENNLAYNAPVAFKAGNVLQDDKQLLPGEAHYVVVKVDMPETVGNEANHDGKNAPKIEFGINVLATQSPYESDSFGNQYDKGAAFEDFANTNILAKETKTLVAGERSIEFDLSNEGLKIASVSVPADAILDPTKPVTVTFDGIERQITGENIEGYAYDIKVTNLKSGLTGDQLVTVVVEAPKALAAMQAYHNGVLIEDAVYDEVAGTVTFKTASFSPYDFTSNVEGVENLDELCAALQKDDYTAKLMADIEVDLTKGSGAARNPDYIVSGYYNGVMINGKNVGLDLNGHNITAFCGDQYNSNSDVGALFFVGKEGSLNITNTGAVETGFIKMKSSIYAVWAPFADPSYVDIYGGAFIADSYAGDTVGTPLGSDGKYDRENGTMSITQENSNRSIIYAGYGGNINVYGGYFLYNNTINDKSNRNNGAFNAKDYYEAGALITIHEGVYLSNKEYRQNPYRNPETNPSFDDYSIKLAEGCAIFEDSESVEFDGNTYSKWYRVTQKKPVSITVNANTLYAVGQEFNISSVVVKYNFGENKTLTADDCEIDAYDFSFAGMKTVTVSYTEFGYTITAEVEVEVTDQFNSLTASSKKNTYDKGYQFTADDFKVTSIDSYGKAHAITGFEIGSVDTTKTGKKTVEISFKNPSTGKVTTTTCEVTIMSLKNISDEVVQYWFFDGNFGVSGWANLIHGDSHTYASYVGQTYTAPNGEIVTGFDTSWADPPTTPNNGATGTGQTAHMGDGRYDLVINDATPYTELGINCIAGYSEQLLGYGWYFDGDLSTLDYKPTAIVYDETNCGGEDPGGYTLLDYLGPNNGHALSFFKCSTFVPGSTHTVHWVAVFEDGVKNISEWTVNMKPASQSDAVFVDTEKPNVNVIIMAGQSNMFGASPITQDMRDKYETYNFSNVYIHYNNINSSVDANGKPIYNTWQTYYSNNGFQKYQLGIGGQSNTHFGPEFELARILSGTDGLKNEQWYIIKYAAAGTGLAAQWMSACTLNGQTTTLTDDMLAYVQSAITGLEADFDVQIRSFMWMQGETDAVDKTWAENYAQNEKNLVDRVRNAFAANATRYAGDPSVPGGGIAFINAGIAMNNTDYGQSEGLLGPNKETGPNDWVWAEIVNAGKVSNCQQLCSVPGYNATAAGTTLATGPLAGLTFMANGVLVPTILNPEYEDAIPNSIYLDTHQLLSKLDSTNEHSDYVGGDATDWAHYGAASMIELGSLFASGHHYMMITGPVQTNKLTVSFDANGGNAVGNMSAKPGDSITLPTPIRDGYTFKGWSDGSKTYAAGAEYTVTGNVTLTAQWEVIKYTITYPTNATNSITTTVDKTQATEGETVTITFENTSRNNKTVYVTVTDKNGNTLLTRTSITLGRYGSTTKDFTVKYSDVTITISRN